MRYTLQAGVHGCRPDPHKIMALKNFKTPTFSTEVSRFWGSHPDELLVAGPEPTLHETEKTDKEGNTMGVAI